MSSNTCQSYVVKAVNYICQMGAHVSEDDVRVLIQDTVLRAAERRVNNAALAGDVAATKTACRAWWEAWRSAIAAVPAQSVTDRVA